MMCDCYCDCDGFLYEWEVEICDDCTVGWHYWLYDDWDYYWAGW